MRIFFLVPFFSLPSFSAIHPNPSTVLSPVDARRLSQTAQWQHLVHYQKDTWGNLESQAQGTDFFLSPKGPKDPGSELIATVEAFQNDRITGGEYAQCRFPARFRWLSKELAPKGIQFPLRFCLSYWRYRDQAATRSVSVVFSSYFLNNPASAFGHIFLRLDKSGAKPDEKRSELLDNGVSFAAVVTQTNAIVYAFYGIFGLFQGTFTQVPYFYKVREYNDYESRDLWEYRLNLTEEEKEMLVAHIWELGSTYYRYYYLTQNCAYHIISTLQVALPETDLVERLPTVSIPVDTVKVIAETPGLVTSIRYRPSLRTAWEERLNTLSAAQKQAVREITTEPSAQLAQFSPKEKVQVYDAALDYMDLRYFKGLITDPLGEAALRKQRLLAARSEIPIPSAHLEVPKPDTAPHEGHDSIRLSVGGGSATDASSFVSGTIRFALHDLLDPVTGYPQYSQIEMLSITGRYRPTPPEISLNELALFRVISLSPVSSFNWPVSWKASVGAARVHDTSCENCLAGEIEVGGGFTAEISPELAAILTADIAIAGAPGFTQNFFRPGVGPSLGVRLQFTPNLIALVTANYRRQFLTSAEEVFYGSGELRWAYQNRYALGAKTTRYPDGWETSLAAYYFF